MRQHQSVRRLVRARTSDRPSGAEKHSANDDAGVVRLGLVFDRLAISGLDSEVS